MTDERVAWLAERACEHLAEHRSQGYEQAAHRMTFPHAAGFTGEREDQVGDAFTRAIIADALCDARDAGFIDCSSVLAAECDYLVASRRRSRVGGWAYFPDLPELPCDIDDLAQVAQVLLRCGRQSDLREFVEVPLGVALRHGVRPSGAIGTWILPDRDLDDEETRQAFFAKAAWGDTPDPEVVANLLYALTIVDRPRFADLIVAGCGWVRSCQAPEGSWASTWYHGPYYGTYACSRLLATVDDHEALVRARGFLQDRQRRDGGWGRGEQCNQLSTALALCAGSIVRTHVSSGPDDVERAAAALDALVTAIVTRGWAAPKFIVMDLGRARGARGPVRSYGSSGITAAYALKAAAALSILARP